MRLELEFEQLKRAILFVQALLPENDVLLTADQKENKLIVEAGCNGVYLKQTVDAQIYTPGSVSVDGPFLTGLYLKGTTILQVKDQKIQFASEKLNGTVSTRQESDRILASRPDVDIETPTQIPKKMLTTAISKTNFSSSMQDGLRLMFDSHIRVSATDQFRLALYKKALGQAVTPFDVLINPTYITKVLSKVEEEEVGFGIKNAVVKISTPSFECFCPSIQSEPQDVNGWLEELPYDECLGTIKTEVETILDTVVATGSVSIASGPAAYETKLSCTVNDKTMRINVVTSNGSANADLELEESDVDELSVNLSHRYTSEMLSLAKSGPVEIKFWEDFLVIYSLEGKCIGVVPTIG